MHRLRPAATCVLAACIAPLASSQTLDAAPTGYAAYPNPGPSDQFGYAVDVDGDWLVAGAPFDDQPGQADAGTAYVFRRVGDQWTSPQNLVPAQSGVAGRYGVAVALAGDVLVIGAEVDDFLATNAGRAVVWVRDDSGGTPTWVELQALEHPSGAAGDYFGAGVAIDGERIVVGAPGDNSNTGSVWVFERDRMGTPGDPLDDQWSLGTPAGLVAEPPDGNSNFGHSVAIEDQVIVVGAPYDDLAGTNAGSVHVFELGSTWTQVQKLALAPADWYGWDVDIDQGRIVASAIFSDQIAVNSGIVTLIEKNFGTWGVTWQFFSSRQLANDNFGVSVAIQGDRVAIGSHHSDVPGIGADTGSVTLFRRSSGTWIESATLQASKPENGGHFGQSLAWSGEDLLVGSPETNFQAVDAGLVHAFTLAFGEFETVAVGDGSTVPCPCNNDSADGLDQGCRNSTGYGAHLTAFGSDAASPDGLRFSAANLPVFQPALLFSGETDLAPGLPFGDGLRAVGAFNIRYSTLPADGRGFGLWGPGLASLPPTYPWIAGSTLYFQVWYRDPFNGPCGNGFNLSNSVAVTFQ